jgi:ABC-type branched-subunit amino acid transport system ATPase component/ABC-type branched-subunit amino acid transport system permease subunit
MRPVSTERLTSVGVGKGSWITNGALLGLLLLGPHNLARVISTVTSVITFPITRDISTSGNPYDVFNLTLLLIYIVVVVGLNLVTQVGQLSVGQSAPFAIGAYIVALATVNRGWSFYVAIAVAAAVAAVIGGLLGVPSLRLGVFTFAMVTLAYGLVTTDLASNGFLAKHTGGFSGFQGVVLPKPFDTPDRFYWFVAGFAALSFVLMRNYIRSPFGRASAAVEANPVAARSVGIRPTSTKLRPFAVSSLLAGAAGGLYAALLGFIAPDSFTTDLAVLWVLMVLLGGAGTILGPLIGAIVLFRIPLAVQTVLPEQPGNWSLLLYGVVLLVSVQFFPRGIISGVNLLKDKLSKRRTSRGERTRVAIESMIMAPTDVDGVVLSVTGVSKNLAGVQALDSVDLAVEAGTVHALIGPNGSGKTTLLNVISGYLTPDQGSVVLLGETVTRVSVQDRARRGLGRTFQTPYIFENVSCRDNLMIVLDQHGGTNGWAHVLRLPHARKQERARYKEALDLLAAVGLSDVADRPAAELPPGERRLLELARIVALKPSVVVMDEPAAGLTESEIEELEEAVRALRAAGVAVLLVEHHVDFILRLADIVTVIDFGQVIARGTPSQVRTDPAVLAAYIGAPTEELAAEDAVVVEGGGPA